MKKIIAFNILDIDINLSDHLPIMVISKYDIIPSPLSSHHSGKPHQSTDVAHFRWDHTPVQLYYEHTRSLLQPFSIIFTIGWLLRYAQVPIDLSLNTIEVVLSKKRQAVV